MIYFVRADEDGPVKIGWTTNILARMNQVRPTPDTVLTIIRLVDREKWVERWFHGQFADARLTGEWFTFDDLMLTLEPPVERPVEMPVPQQAVPLHIRLPEADLEALKARAAREERPVATMARLIIQRALRTSAPQRNKSAQEPT